MWSGVYPSGVAIFCSGDDFDAVKHVPNEESGDEEEKSAAGLVSR